MREAQHLNGESEIRRFKKDLSSVAQRQASMLDLVANDDDLQRAGVAAAYYVGRTDGRALILLRRLLFSMGDAARKSAVWALACAVPHPDIFHTLDGSPDPEACRVLEPTLCWTVDEVVELLVLIDEEQGIDRGTFGQHVYHLLVMDPGYASKTADAAIEAARRGKVTAATWLWCSRSTGRARTATPSSADCSRLSRRSARRGPRSRSSNPCRTSGTSRSSDDAARGAYSADSSAIRWRRSESFPSLRARRFFRAANAAFTSGSLRCFVR